ncbi:MAG: MG2 domain-containing protein, partial [Planctomycetota bacterium]
MSEGRDFYREKVLAYQLGALDAEEARQIEALIGSDPAWKQAAEEARAMREGLEQARYGVLPPADLLARTQRHLQRGRQRGTRLVAAAAGLAATVLLALGVAWLLVSPARGSLIWRVEDRLFAGARVAPELVVCDPEDGSPIEGAHVEARLIDESRAVVPLGSGRTTAAGQVPGSWRVPDVAAGRFTLEVEARDDDGLLDRFASTVMVTPGVRLSVSTDRPAARPGEAMRARALCTRLDGGRPVADRPLTFELLDPSGTAIGRRHVQTSTYGLASASFPLDRELPEGRYVIRARVGDEEGERAFRLGMFRLPPYDVQIRLDRPLAAPGEPVAGQLRARTFDGHAIEGLEAVVRLGPKKVTVRLDDDGRGRFSLGAPSPGRHALSVRVRDAAGRTTEARRTVRVAGGRALFDLLPEAGELIPGLENRIYIVARRLDGSPLPGPVAIRGGAPVSLDEDGVGVLRHTPKRDVRSEFDLAAPDAPTDWQMFAPALREHNGGLLLRCARAVYESGDAIDVTLHSVHPEGRVLLSLQRDRRTVAVGVAELR